MIRGFSEDQMAAVYRAPYPEREARMPTLAWPRQIPINGKPADVTSPSRSCWCIESNARRDDPAGRRS
jgi:haloalkane dehalogenase